VQTIDNPFAASLGATALTEPEHVVFCFKTGEAAQTFAERFGCEGVARMHRGTQPQTCPFVGDSASRSFDWSPTA
jgi:hypothetical protein